MDNLYNDAFKETNDYFTNLGMEKLSDGYKEIATSKQLLQEYIDAMSNITEKDMDEYNKELLEYKKSQAIKVEIVKIREIKPIENTNYLSIGKCRDKDVIVSNDIYESELGIYIPEDVFIEKEFANLFNLIKKKDENGRNIGGYLDEDRMVRKINLHGKKSYGIFIELGSLIDYIDVRKLKEGDTITEINGNIICSRFYDDSQIARSMSFSKTIRTLWPVFKLKDESSITEIKSPRFRIGKL